MRLAEFSTRLLYKKSGENQSADFFYTTVDIPMLMESLTVSVTTHSSSFAQIPFALFSPSSELRILKTSEGGSGDYHVSCRISSSSSDRGGLSGVIEKGRWKLILQKRRFSEDITADVIIDGAPLSAEVKDARPKRLEKRIISQHSGWYRGELHVHSDHSTGRDSIGKILEVAEKTGLDYIAITDHFTISHWEEEACFSESSVLIIQSMELSGNRGHANLHGIKSLKNPYVDDDGTLARFFGLDKMPDMEAVADSVHEEGGLFSINHPDSNIASAWRYHEFPMSKADIFEVWCTSEGDFSLRYPAIWDQYLKKGMKLTGVCSSDSHKAENHPLWSLGKVMTYVYAQELSERGIIEGIKSGRVFMARGNAVLDFYAEEDGRTIFMGGGADDISKTVFNVRLSQHPRGNLFIYLSGQVHDIVHFDGGECESYQFTVPLNQIGYDDNQYIRLEYYDELEAPRFWGDTPRTQSALRLMSNPIYFKRK